MSARNGLPPAIKWGLLAFIIVLPAVLTPTTFSVAFSRTKTVEFCASCHVMESFTDDLKDPHSGTLAAKHYTNKWINEHQCATCHTNYDFLGPVDAKIRGMRHAAAYYLTPSRMKIKLYEPFPNSQCLHCHGDTAKYKDNVAHMAVEEEIASGAMSCISCHEPVHPKPKEGAQ